MMYYISTSSEHCHSSDVFVNRWCCHARKKGKQKRTFQSVTVQNASPPFIQWDSRQRPCEGITLSLSTLALSPLTSLSSSWWTVRLSFFGQLSTELFEMYFHVSYHSALKLGLYIIFNSCTFACIIKIGFILYRHTKIVFLA